MQELQEQIPAKTKSCAIIAVIHELSGLVLVNFLPVAIAVAQSEKNSAP